MDWKRDDFARSLGQLNYWLPDVRRIPHISGLLFHRRGLTIRLTVLRPQVQQNDRRMSLSVKSFDRFFSKNIINRKVNERENQMFYSKIKRHSKCQKLKQTSE